MSDMRLSCRDATNQAGKFLGASEPLELWLVTSRQAEAYRTLFLPLDIR